MLLPRPGQVVLYDNGWNHNDNGRPHVVVAVCPTRGIRLCPLSTTPAGRPDAPIRARNGGLKFDSWVAATDCRHCNNQLLWADPTHIGRTVCRLTQAELDTVKIVATTQLQRRRSRVAALA
jgi:hypothetical protein